MSISNDRGRFHQDFLNIFSLIGGICLFLISKSLILLIQICLERKPQIKVLELNIWTQRKALVFKFVKLNDS